MPPNAEGDLQPTAPLDDGDAVAQEGQDPADLLLEGARYGDLDDVRAALDAGAPVNVADDQGRTALHMAAANGHSPIVTLLLQRGADVGARNRELNTPLHWAAMNGRSEVASQLMAYRSDPAALNRHERTPIDEAVHHGHLAIIDVVNTAMLSVDAAHVSITDDGQGG